MQGRGEEGSGVLVGKLCDWTLQHNNSEPLASCALSFSIFIYKSMLIMSSSVHLLIF